MDKNQSVERAKQSRWERLQRLELKIPEAGEPPASELNDPQPVKTATLGAPDYPLLRVWLRDRQLDFKPVYSQRDVTQVIGKSDKTVRSWTRKKQIPYHCWPWGEVYYTAQDLEDLLTSCEPVKRGAK